MKKLNINKKNKEKLIEGTFLQHQRGFGFVSLDEEGSSDIFIPADKTGSAFQGDRVRIVIEKKAAEDGSSRAEGRIVEVVSHEITELIGSFYKNKGFGFVVPDDKHIITDIFIPAKACGGADTGDKVVCELTSYGDRRNKPEGRITEIIGNINDKGMDITSAVRASGISYSFPEELKAELDKIPSKLTNKDIKGRLDLRDELCVTIDGEDSKDLDDAVSLSYDKQSGLYRLSVHIADVSQYVREYTLLDACARQRGTSVYLPDRVIPMLPKKLSNGICSLNEGEDRLVLSCIMDINSKGSIVSHRICESVIRSKHRLTYSYVYSLLTDAKVRRSEPDKELCEMLRLMHRLSGILRRRRKRSGSVDFDFPEAKIILDKSGRVVDIHPYEINDANLLIEDFMLAANETVAMEFAKKGIPFLYRTHEPPSEERAAELIAFVQGLGFSVKKSKDGLKDPKELAAILETVAESPEAGLIETAALRSMSKAKYTAECLGHYGLSKQYYTHFTSPIRRYPDLQIHRIIKECLKNGGSLTDKRKKHYEELLPTIAKKSTDSEIKAMELERDCEKLKKCEYMSRFIGESFNGIISGVTAYGFYVELPNTCEGMVHVNSLVDDYYIYDEKHFTLRGERFGRQYRLGDSAKIVVTASDKEQRTIDFRTVYGE